ncbi:hypothetical protein [Microcella pacifica]|uniref:Uncharacterized protein n=1 Tax=Microcella pacifica TaxID=2591847 RepID=A0A9E5JMY0_9MICO|nr:hypothetical protein [Microcella pacifica]NHF61851.1 hypothetical protein [Microcella pacifica]
MDTLRYFKDLAKAQHREFRGSIASDSVGLQRVQHLVAVNAGYASWDALRGASSADRDLAVAMTLEPHLCINGFGAGSFDVPLEARRARFAGWRLELRGRATHVAEILKWLESNVERRKTINPDYGSYGLKHMAERHLGAYVANGEFIAAAIIAGYPYRRGEGTSPNATFGMSSRSLAVLRRGAA